MQLKFLKNRNLMLTESPHISVIIPTFNKAVYLDLTLASWCYQEREDFGLIVVVDGSTDNTREILEKYASRLPLNIIEIKNTGRAGARNVGLKQARGSVIVFSDDDRVVVPGFLNAHFENLANNPDQFISLGWQYGVLTNIGQDCYLPTDLLVKVVRERPELGDSVITGNAARLFSADDLDKDFSLIDTWYFHEPWFEEYLHPAIKQFGDELTACPLVWAFGTTGNLAISKKVLEQAGGFDEDFSGWGNEDTELNYRLISNGMRTRVARQAINYHQNHPRDIGQLKWNWLRTAGIFLNKHPDIRIALYIQAVMWNLPYPDIFKIVEEVESNKDSNLVHAYSRLLINNARELTTYGDIINWKRGNEVVAVSKLRF